ncbi:unnamed protein product, partial [Owenia fusiformis]
MRYQLISLLILLGLVRMVINRPNIDETKDKVGNNFKQKEEDFQAALTREKRSRGQRRNRRDDNASAFASETPFEGEAIEKVIERREIRQNKKERRDLRKCKNTKRKIKGRRIRKQRKNLDSGIECTETFETITSTTKGPTTTTRPTSTTSTTTISTPNPPTTTTP